MTNINVSTPNSGDGEKLRQAMIFINANFAELQTKFSDYTPLADLAELANDVAIQIQDINEQLANLPVAEIPTFQQVINQGNQVLSPNGRGNFTINMNSEYPLISYRSESPESSAHGGSNVSAMELYTGSIFFATQTLFEQANLQLGNGKISILTGTDWRKEDKKVVEFETPKPLSNSKVYFPQPTVDGTYTLSTEEFVNAAIGGIDLNSKANVNDQRIINGQTAFSWGNHANKYLNRELSNAQLDANEVREGVITGYQWINTPVSTIGILTTIIYSPDWKVQTFTVIRDNHTTWKRSFYDGTTWGIWVEVFDEGNFNPELKADKSAVLNKIGDSGVVFNNGAANILYAGTIEGALGTPSNDACLYAYVGKTRFFNSGVETFQIGPTIKSFSPIESDEKISAKSFETKSDVLTTEILPIGIQTTDITDPLLPTTSILKLNRNGITFNGNSNNGNNTVFGYDALPGGTGSFNTAYGVRALFSNTTGQANTAFGQNALRYNTTGQQNLAVGYNTLAANISGRYNTALGYNSLAANTVGEWNTAVGFDALRSNTNAVYNTAIGQRAGRNCTEGTRNTFLGVDTGSLNILGGFNTLAGMGAGQIGTYLNGTTIFGQAAGSQLTSSEFNTFVGRNAGANITTGSSNVIVAAGNFVAEGSGIIAGNNNTIVGTVRGLGDVSNNVVIADGLGNVALKKDADGKVSFPSGSIITDEIIMTSPNGTKWRVRIDDAGTFAGVIE